MNTKGHLNPAESKIQTALAAFLRSRGPDETESSARHLDDDVLTAFVEGNLSDREAMPVVSHLVDCTFCLHVSAELIKLDTAFAADTAVVSEPVTEPEGIGSVLEGILSRIFGSGERAVFAHEEQDGEEKEKPEDAEEQE